MGTRYTRRQIQEAIAYWKRLLKAGEKKNRPRRLDEGKISDFFGRLFKTKKFVAQQKELLKQKNYKEHPLMAVADKMNRGPFYVRFTNADMENDGYPQTFSHKYDCIAVKLDRGGNDRYDKLEDREDDIMALARKCGLPEGYGFCKVDDDMGVIVPEGAANWNVVELDEDDGGDFEKIDDIVKWCKDKKVRWKNIYKQEPIKVVKEPKPGETVETVASDGTSETSSKAKAGQWVVCNAANEKNQWLVKDGVLKKDYVEKKGGERVEIDSVEAGKTYFPKTKEEGGEGRLFAKLSDYTDKDVAFVPPNWGGTEMRLKNNGYLFRMPDDEKDIYPVSIADFENSYKAKG